MERVQCDQERVLMEKKLVEREGKKEGIVQREGNLGGP